RDVGIGAYRLERALRESHFTDPERHLEVRRSGDERDALAEVAEDARVDDVDRDDQRHAGRDPADHEQGAAPAGAELAFADLAEEPHHGPRGSSGYCASVTSSSGGAPSSGSSIVCCKAPSTSRST